MDLSHLVSPVKPLPRWLKDPLVHFLVAGTVLFVVLPTAAATSARVAVTPD